MKFCSFWTLGLISSCFLNTAIAGDLSLAIMPLQTNSVVVTSMSKLVFSSPSIEVKISITPLLIWNVLKKGKCWLPEYILLKGCVTKNNHVPLKELEELLRAYVEKSQKNNIRSVQCQGLCSADCRRQRPQRWINSSKNIFDFEIISVWWTFFKCFKLQDFDEVWLTLRS